MASIRPSIAAIVLVIAVAIEPCSAQQWGPGGVRLCQNGCPGDIPRVVSDGASGAYVAWRDVRNSDDVYLQRVTPVGMIAPGWPLDGLPIVLLSSQQELSSLAPDGLGGALVAWEDWRNPPLGNGDSYVQRVIGDASLPAGWALYGNPASQALREQSRPQVAPDGVGGAYVVWEDDRDHFTTSPDVYAQHLTAAGTVTPGWPADGFPLSALAGYQGGGFVMPDDSAGALFVWTDGRPGAPGAYALRLRADGTLAPGWPANGILLTNLAVEGTVRDGAGGFYVASPTPGPALGFDGSYYLSRFRFDGAPAPGWPSGGVLVCNAPDNRAGITLDADGMGGALLTWYDYRSFVSGEIFAARVLADGSLAPGWAVNGTLVSDPTDAMQSYDPFVAPDGLGGGYFVWQSQGSSDLPSTIQHLTGSGQPFPGWPQYGLRVAPSHDQVNTRIVADGVGGAIIAWDEACCGRLGIWAQRYGPDGPTPVLVSLVSAAAEPDRVTLLWQLADGSVSAATVYRRTLAGPWEVLGAASPEGVDRARFQDRGVVAGTRYAYRLGWLEAGTERHSAETWVDVPNRLELALEGFRPNPSVGSPSVAFTLPDASPATLEAYDIAGRQVAAREVGSLGPGRHQLNLDTKGLNPGVYHLRLRRAGTTIVARGLLMR